jgi:ElaB/YqjD/DUF883 family membrane-anchored ribosome-binding protein
MTQATLAQLTSAQARNKSAGGAFIGCIIGWRVSTNIRISHASLEAIADNCGVPSRLLPVAVKPAKAFRKAVEKTRSIAKDSGLMLRYIGKTPLDEDESIIVGLVKETPDIAAQNLHYNVKGIINYEAGDLTENISVTYPEIATELREKFEFFQEHTSDDIRKILLAFTSKWTVRLTPSGGSYFVPATNNKILNSIRAFVGEVGQHTDSKVFSFEMYDSPQNQTDLGEAATSNLESEIQELAADLEDFLESATHDSTKFDKGLANRQAQVMELQSRVHAFASVLDFQASVLYSKLNKIEKSISGEQTHRCQIKGKIAAICAETQPIDNPDSSNEIGF